MSKKLFVFLPFAFLLLLAGDFRAQNARELFVLTVQVSGTPGQITSSPPGITCGQDLAYCSGTFPQGTPVMLKPRVLGRGQFGGWSSGVGSAQPCLGSRGDCYFVMMENSSVRAEFVTD